MKHTFSRSVLSIAFLTFLNCTADSEKPQTFCLINHIHGKDYAPASIYFTYNLKSAHLRLLRLYRSNENLPADIFSEQLPEGNTYYYVALQKPLIENYFATQEGALHK